MVVSCGVGRRRSLDLALLLLWCRPAAIASIGSLALESPYAVDVALKRQKKNIYIYVYIYIYIYIYIYLSWRSNIGLQVEIIFHSFSKFFFFFEALLYS